MSIPEPLERFKLLSYFALSLRIVLYHPFNERIDIAKGTYFLECW